VKRTDRSNIPTYVWCVFVKQGSEWYLLATFSHRKHAVNYRRQSLPEAQLSIEKFHRSTGPGR
jgi:hypothetical protein